MIAFAKRLILGRGGDVFNICIVVCCVLLALLGAYWVAALVFGIVTAIAARFFRWPMERIVIPLALALRIGRTRFTAWLGVLFVGACLAGAIYVVLPRQADAVRRIGQNLELLKKQLPEGYAEKIDAFAIEGLGTNRVNRLHAWLWEKDMAREDAYFDSAAVSDPVTAKMLDASDQVDAWGLQLENRVFEGEQRQWFVYVYWFIVAVVLPMLVCAFIITVYQVSARRIATYASGLITRGLVSLTTFALLYFLIAAFYLFPYVSHPYHTPGISFWVPIVLYIVGGAICCGVVRANHHILFTDDAVPMYDA